MARLDLEFVGLKEIEGNIALNGKFIKLKKDKEKNYTCSIENAETNNELIIYKSHNYVGKHWILWNLLYFFISIFGVFDIRQNKKCLVLDGRFNISTEQDTKITLRRQNFEDGGKLVNIETDCEVEEIANVQYYDKEAKKRHSKMKKIKIAAAIISITLVIVLITLL